MIDESSNIKRFDILYIAPSKVPTKAANNVNILHQCYSFSNLGYACKLYAATEIPNNAEIVSNIKTSFFIDLSKVDFCLLKYPFSRGHALAIAVYFFLKNFVNGELNKAIYSRNLYASYGLSFFKKTRHCYEAHLMESGFRAVLFRRIARSKNVQISAISSALAQDIKKLNPLKKVYVLHDAAPSFKHLKSICEYCELPQQFGGLVSEARKTKVGYFGSLLSGRGIELICAVAQTLPTINFYVFGGTLEEIRKYKTNHRGENIYFCGQLSHANSLKTMTLMDILLMPYQSTVKIPSANTSTEKWMSPIKMFEYLASGVPVISSNLLVLREVLKHKENCLLVDPTDVSAWSSSIKKLIKNKNLRTEIVKNAKKTIENEHNWDRRAIRIKKILNNA